MKVIQINSTCGIGSTGKIANAISALLDKDGINNRIIYSNLTNGYEKGISCSNGSYIKFQAFKSRIYGNYGFNSKLATKKMICEIEKFSPDFVILHNIHGHDCNLELLFNYFKKSNIKLYWVFHDCWAFTGYCTHFTMDKCNKWIDNCNNCVQRKKFSWFFDRSSELYCKKKELFSGLNLTIITPSVWLRNLVTKSFFNNYEIKVINNGIDLNVFCPRPSDFRKKNGILKNQFMLLGVSLGWSIQKGIDVFIELANRLDVDKYKIVLVGTDDKLDRILPKNIISIHRTQNQQQLAEIYSAADLYVNPTREENFPTVNIESISCGTPVITFNTGGSPEIIDESCGKVVECDDIDGLESNIIDILNNNRYSTHACIKRASLFNKDDKFMEYIKIFKGNL